jgi:beta-lactamase regulating signal transducer with metallopeptidase domain
LDRAFLQLLNMSIAAGWLILAVMVLRLFMKKAPKWLTCILWGIVAIRLSCPFLLESRLSLIPSKQLISPYRDLYAQRPSITSGIPSINAVVNPVFSDTFSPAAGASANPLHIWLFFAGILWFLGFLIILFCALASFFRIRKNVEEAIPLSAHVWSCDHVNSPFILGVFRPKIYLPSDIKADQFPHVLAHENAHLKRRDHWWKPFGYLLLSVYWFHPLVWAAYILFSRDIELACDEKVIKNMNLNEKKAYSHTLVSLSMHKRLVSVCPLAFGESNIKKRVNSILHYKKPAFWILLSAAAVCIVAAVCFLTNPIEKSEQTDGKDGAGYDIIPMVMINNQYYYDTGKVSSRTNRKTGFDGEITSSVDGSKIPQANNESNFGSGYGYQYGDNGTIEININGTWSVFEYRSGDGSMIWYQDQWYSKEDLSEDTIKWLEQYNRLSPKEQLAVNYVPWDLYELSGLGKDLDSPAAIETDASANKETNSETSPVMEDIKEDKEANGKGTPLSALELAIHDAIIQKNKNSYSPIFDIACCDFAMLEMITEALPESSTASTVVCYGWVFYQRYLVSENGLEAAGGHHIPTALTFEVKQDQYILKEYWEPRDGSYFVSDIQDKFPEYLVQDGIDSQKFIIRQQQSCYSQAVQNTGLDTDAVISRLLDALCLDPGSSFDPQSISGQNNTEYRELIKYGQYTLSYCFGQFNRGGETGLKGRIMALICEELLQTRGTLPFDAANAATGQLWYDTLYAHASNLVIPYLKRGL